MWVTGEEFIVKQVTAQQAHNCKLREETSVRTGVVREDFGRGGTMFIVKQIIHFVDGWLERALGNPVYLSRVPLSSFLTLACD